MSKTTDALSAVATNWEQLKEQRPSEGDFAAHGFPLSYSGIDEIFEKWRKTLSLLDEKGYWNTTPEFAIADGPLAALMNNINGMLINAKSQGIGWLLSTGFMDVVHNFQFQLSVLTQKQASVSREVAKLLEEKGAESIELILSAAEAAKSVIGLRKQAFEDAQKIAETSTEVEDASILAESTTRKLSDLANEASSDATSVGAQKREVERLLQVAAETLASSIDQQNVLKAKALDVDEVLEKTDELAKGAIESVKQALRAVRDQGLAKSFQDRSNKLRHERTLWTTAFAASAVFLLALAVAFASDLETMTYESLVVHLLRKIGLAAPLVWLGWYSARQVGRISRVQEDYEYKAASALAFQAYKEEANVGGDPELTKRLLEHAIKTFGENPVRLYEHHQNEPVTPVQAAIKELPPEKIAAILAAIGEQSLKAKFWPFGGKA